MARASQRRRLRRLELAAADAGVKRDAPPTFVRTIEIVRHNPGTPVPPLQTARIYRRVQAVIGGHHTVELAMLERDEDESSTVFLARAEALARTFAVDGASIELTAEGGQGYGPEADVCHTEGCGEMVIGADGDVRIIPDVAPADFDALEDAPPSEPQAEPTRYRSTATAAPRDTRMSDAFDDFVRRSVPRPDHE